MRSISSSLEVRKITGTSDLARSRAHTSVPSSSGIRMSSTTSAGNSRAATSSAARPLPAVSGW